ncbi:PASTA domain-containing protein [Mobiluncus mulieris]|uniref:PASTA domain-containing protein n=1 Tax=Mobiluncus mulieris TaxID=2052 RepID=A0A7Y0U341_9ACTO|nr:PASTA domain-containing protein [Mobiluncus mulieris]NMW66015.1 PASTA domain-containing protein [Mobiluncus mulieris]
MSKTNATTRKPWWRRWWVIAIGIVIALGVIGAIVNPSSLETGTEMPSVSGKTVAEATRILASKQIYEPPTIQTSDGKPAKGVDDFTVSTQKPLGGKNLPQGEKPVLILGETQAQVKTALEKKAAEIGRVEAQTYCGEEWKRQLALKYEKYKIKDVFGAKATKITSTGKWYVVLAGEVNGAKFNFECLVGGTKNAPDVELTGMK